MLSSVSDIKNYLIGTEILPRGQDHRENRWGRRLGDSRNQKAKSESVITFCDSFLSAVFPTADFPFLGESHRHGKGKTRRHLQGGSHRIGAQGPAHQESETGTGTFVKRQRFGLYDTIENLLILIFYDMKPDTAEPPSPSAMTFTMKWNRWVPDCNQHWILIGKCVIRHFSKPSAARKKHAGPHPQTSHQAEKFGWRTYQKKRSIPHSNVVIWFGCKLGLPQNIHVDFETISHFLKLGKRYGESRNKGQKAECRCRLNIPYATLWHFSISGLMRHRIDTLSGREMERSLCLWN